MLRELAEQPAALGSIAALVLLATHIIHAFTASTLRAQSTTVAPTLKKVKKFFNILSKKPPLLLRLVSVLWHSLVFISLTHAFSEQILPFVLTEHHSQYPQYPSPLIFQHLITSQDLILCKNTVVELFQ